MSDKNDPDIFDCVTIPDRTMAEYTPNAVVKAMLLGGFKQVIADNSRGEGVVEMDALDGYFVGVLEAAKEIQTKINSCAPRFPLYQCKD